MLLKDKRAIITGATRGIGKAIAEAFVGEGASVVIAGRDGSIHDLATELSSAGQRVTAVQGDLRDGAYVHELVTVCRKQYGGLDILVNNAGVLTQGLIGMMALDPVREMLDVNLVALINLTQYAIRLMAKSVSPSIINIASIAGTQGIEGVSAYSASKAAVVGFTLSAAKELASRGIRVNAIAPGFIDTDMTRSLPSEWYQKRVDGIRMGKRIGSPHDIANCALFLASDLSSYVTGQVIGVDGGLAV